MKQQERLEKACRMCENIVAELLLLQDYFSGSLQIIGTLDIIRNYAAELQEMLGGLRNGEQ